MSMDAPSTGTPKTIGRFQVESLLGVGGMGEVYKAVDPTLRRTVAIKTVRPDIDRPDYLERLYREAQACARLQHPNIVTVYEAGEIDGVVYIAMEYLRGEDLATVLRRRELSVESKIRILTQILDALDHAHNEDVVHRDIKPSNVYRQLDGSIKLVDFGLARMMRAETLTLSGAVMGTPHYASPEQLKGEPIDKRTDIYSVGVLAYEMFAGRRPFQTDYDSVATIVLKVISEPTPPMDVSISRRFPAIENIIDKAMAKAAKDRYQSAAEMRSALASFFDQSRDAISTVELELQTAAEETVAEARSLLEAGRKEDAQTLLTSVLKFNPDARGVGELLDATRAGTTTLGATVPIERHVAVPPPPLGVTESAPSTAPAVVPAAAGAATVAHQVQEAPHPETATRGVSPLWWIAGAAIAALLIVAVWISQPADSTVNEWTWASASPATTAVADPPAAAPPAQPPAASPTPAPSAAAAPGPAAAAPSVTAPPSASKPAAPPLATAAVPVPAAPTGPAADPAPAPAAPAPSAKQLFYNEGAGAADVANAGLRYRLIQQAPGGGETDVDPTTTFHSGDRVRFAFESNVDGYLYVVQQGSSGRWTVLFPNPDINGGRNQIKKFEEYTVPEGAWFTFDDRPGTEQVFVFLSRDAVAQLPGFDRPVTRMESVQGSVVETLQRSIRSRDLVFERERPSGGAKPSQATFVVNREEVGKAVAAQIQLVHVQ
jgi:serine/threonine-protein kinase